MHEQQQPTATVPGILAELEQIKRSVARIERSVSQLGGASVARERRRPERYYLVLLGVYEHGRRGMSNDAFGALGARYGYDRRGLGGFFVGARAALNRDGDRVRLTPEGQSLLDDYLQEAT